MGIKAKSELK